ncbi:hypothetical protein BLNAU_16390 [Blattamonas nauphoetae]|uniref:Uncharacterized protein n=1 Tax=Blattamonas nauphoetae TaxID=2049346 RepID=A0ABQ9XAE1_9EUKA|nr:hypothetical protein BLNAU_16390 [Blattamonas nauphoetae]
MSGFCLYFDSVQEVPEDPKIRDRLDNCSFYHRLHMSMYDSVGGVFLGDTYESIPYNPIEISTGIFTSEVRDMFFFLCPEEANAVMIIEVVSVAVDQYNRIKREIGLGWGCLLLSTGSGVPDISQFEKKSFYPLMQEVALSQGTPRILLNKKEIPFEGGSAPVPGASLQLTLITNNRLSLLSSFIPPFTIFDERNGSPSIPGLLTSHLSAAVSLLYKDELVQAIESLGPDRSESRGRSIGSPSKSRSTRERKKENKAMKEKRRELERILRAELSSLILERDQIIENFSQEKKKKRRNAETQDPSESNIMSPSPKEKKKRSKDRDESDEESSSSLGDSLDMNDEIESEFDEIVEEKENLLPSLTDANWTNNPFWDKAEFRDKWRLSGKDRTAEERGRTAIEMIGAHRLIVGSKVTHGQIHEAPWSFGRTLFHPIPQERIPIELRNLNFLIPMKVEDTIRAQLNYVRLKEQFAQQASQEMVTITARRVFIIPHSDLSVCGEIEVRDLVSTGNAAKKRVKIGSTIVAVSQFGISDPKTVTLRTAFAHPKFGVMFAVVFTVDVPIDIKPPDKKDKNQNRLNLPSSTTRSIWMGWVDYSPFRAETVKEGGEEGEEESSSEEDDESEGQWRRPRPMEKLKKRIVLTVPDLSAPVKPKVVSKATRTKKKKGRTQTTKNDEHDEAEADEPSGQQKKIQLKLTNQFMPPPIHRSVSQGWLFNPSRGVNTAFRAMSNMPQPSAKPKAKKGAAATAKPTMRGADQPDFEPIFPFDRLHPYTTPFHIAGPESIPTAILLSESLIHVTFSMTFPAEVKDWTPDLLSQPNQLAHTLPLYLQTPFREQEQEPPEGYPAVSPTQPTPEMYQDTFAIMPQQSFKTPITQNVHVDMEPALPVSPSVSRGLGEAGDGLASLFTFEFTAIRRGGLTDPQGLKLDLPKNPIFILSLFDQGRIASDTGMVADSQRQGFFQLLSLEFTSLLTGNATVPFHSPPPQVLAQLPFKLSGGIASQRSNTSVTLPDFLISTPVQVDIIDASTRLLFGTAYLKLEMFADEVASGQVSNHPREILTPILLPFPSPDNVGSVGHQNMHICHLYPASFTNPPDNISLGTLSVRVIHKRTRAKITPTTASSSYIKSQTATALMHRSMSPAVTRQLTVALAPNNPRGTSTQMHPTHNPNLFGTPVQQFPDSDATQGTSRTNPLSVLLQRNQNDLSIINTSLIRVQNVWMNQIAQPQESHRSGLDESSDQSAMYERSVKSVQRRQGAEERKRAELANINMMHSSTTRVLFPSFAVPLVFDLPFQNPLQRSVEVCVWYTTLSDVDSNAMPRQYDEEQEIRLASPQEAQRLRQGRSSSSPLSAHAVSSLDPPNLENEIVSFTVQANQRVDVPFVFQSFSWVPTKNFDSCLDPIEALCRVDDFSLPMRERVVEIAFTDENHNLLLLQHIVICPTPVAPNHLVNLYTSSDNTHDFNLSLLEQTHMIPFNHTQAQPFVKKAIVASLTSDSSLQATATLVSSPQPHLSLRFRTQLTRPFVGEMFHIALFNDAECTSLFGTWSISVNLLSYLNLNSSVGEVIQHSEPLDKTHMAHPSFHNSPLSSLIISNSTQQKQQANAVSFSIRSLSNVSRSSILTLSDLATQQFKRFWLVNFTESAGQPYPRQTLRVNCGLAMQPTFSLPFRNNDPSQQTFLVSVSKPLSAVPLQPMIKAPANQTINIHLRLSPSFYEGTTGFSVFVNTFRAEFERVVVEYNVTVVFGSEYQNKCTLVSED